MARTRDKQLGYSEIQNLMLDQPGRQQKAEKILRVLAHFRGTDDLVGARVLDLGCSLGFFVEAAAERGAIAVGVDIDVAGLAAARAARDLRAGFLCADGEALPFPDASLDVVVFNHIYEHVVDADKVMAEIRRVLRPDGIVYLGMANKLVVVEPHYKLPFLSWLPHRAADAYMKRFGPMDAYHERFRTYPGLRKMATGLHVHDYTFSILADSGAFAAQDVVPGPAPRLFRALPSTVGGAAADRPDLHLDRVALRPRSGRTDAAGTPDQAQDLTPGARRDTRRPWSGARTAGGPHRSSKASRPTVRPGRRPIWRTPSRTPGMNDARS